MKKVLALILVLLMAVSVLAACGDKKDDNTTTAAVNNGAAVTNNGNAVAVTIPGVEDDVVATGAQTDVVTPAALTQEALIGKWNMAVDMGNVVNALLGMEIVSEDMAPMVDIYKAILDGITLDFTLDFKADGQYAVSMDGTQGEAIVQTVFDNTINYMRNGGLEEILALSGEGVTVEDLEASLAQQGMTMDDYYDMMAQQLTESMSMEDITSGFEEEGGDYTLTADTLFIDMDMEDLGMSSEFSYSYNGTTITLLENIDGQTHPFTGAVMTKIG